MPSQHGALGHGRSGEQRSLLRVITMQYPTVSVNGVSVRIDEEGRYNLNDLHAAAVANGEATESQRPSVFLRSAQIKRFVKALEVKAQKKLLVNKSIT